MQKNRLNSSAENSGKKKAAEQILISTHNAAIKYGQLFPYAKTAARIFILLIIYKLLDHKLFGDYFEHIVKLLHILRRKMLFYPRYDGFLVT